MKQNRSLYIVIALLVVTNVASIATAAAAQTEIVGLRDGEEILIRCICQPDTPTPQGTPVYLPAQADPAQEKEYRRSPDWDGSGGIIEELTGGKRGR